MEMSPRTGPSRRAAAGPAETGDGSRLVRMSSSEHIALHIRRLIFDGTLRPGMRVPQDAIAQELGVSRIPVREALIVLEREGWVTIEMHRGAFINALDEQSVVDHYDLFGLVYGFAAQRALARSNGDLPDRLRQVRDAFAAAATPEEQQRLSLAFHGAILQAAASPRVEVVLRALSTLIPGNFFAAVPEAVDVERRGFAAIVRALQRGEGEQAAAEYARMMRRVGHQVADLFKARGLFATPAAG